MSRHLEVYCHGLLRLLVCQPLTLAMLHSQAVGSLSSHHQLAHTRLYKVHLEAYHFPLAQQKHRVPSKPQKSLDLRWLASKE